jgi:thioredoxin reductase (NADPH)
MAKPIIFTVNDNSEVLQFVPRDLRHQYGDRFRVMWANSGLTALDALQQLKLRNEFVR